MEICTLASGSSGNCTLLRSGDTAVLIDAGISLRRIKTALSELGLHIEDVAGVVITHEHSDHIAALKMLARYTSVPIFVPSGAAPGIRAAVPETEESLALFTAGEDIVIGQFVIKSFRTPHDAPESVGYRFEDGESTFALCTDLGCVTRTVFDGVTGADTVIIEANHDEDMLKNGRYPAYLKRRILSDSGHLSNAASGEFAAALAETGTRRIILGHLSHENNLPGLALRAVGSALSAAGFCPGRDIELYAAPRSTMGDVYIC